MYKPESLLTVAISAELFTQEERNCGITNRCNFFEVQHYKNGRLCGGTSYVQIYIYTQKTLTWN